MSPAPDRLRSAPSTTEPAGNRPGPGPARCPVRHEPDGAWTLTRHADVVAAALDPETFSSRASRYLNVPNGMDGEEHTRYRLLVDRHLSPERIGPLEPRFRALADRLSGSLPTDRPVDAVTEIGARFAVRAQSAWLGWPTELEGTLLAWMEENREASRTRDPARTARVAERFDEIIRSLIRVRTGAGGDAPDDATTRLMNDRVDGRPLDDAEIVSVLRNWTAGDLGSIAACIGVIVHRLATDPELQHRWRHSRPDRHTLEMEIDEILRIDDPFTFNRRIATRDVEVGGELIRAGDQVRLNWTAANRDPEAMGDPDAFRPAENAPRNIVYGAGPHVCPGRGLATLELRVMIETLVDATREIVLAPGTRPARALPPYGGYRTVPVLITR